MFLWLFFLVCSFSSFSQSVDKVSFSVLSEAIGLPFTNYQPFHPGFEFKARFKEIEKPKFSRSINANLGFFYHERVETTFYLGAEYQFEYKILNDKISVDIPLGLGYMHTFYPNEVYVQDSDGEFELKSQLGRPHAYFNAGVGLSYLGSSKVKPFVRQELLLETFFANGLPAIPHSMIKLGVHINIKSNDKE